MMDAIGPPRRISSLRFTSIRKFEDFELNFKRVNPDGGGVTLLIGKNGTCKSTFLRAIAVGLADASDASALLSHPSGSLVSHHADKAQIDIKLVGSDPNIPPVEINRQIISVKGKNQVFTDWEEASRELGLFVCGYGAGRGIVGTDQGRAYRIMDSVYGLFDYSRILIDPELTLRRLQDYLGEKRYKATLNGIKKMLDLGDEDEIQLAKGGGVEIVGPSVGAPVRLDEWADGYRLTFNWLMDFYAWAIRADRVNDAGEVTGILLIDEIDQHLHPSLQARVIPQLSQMMRRVQIIATTHSPLVALGCDPRDLVVLKTDGEVVVREQKVPDYSGYSAADMLEDDRLFESQIYSTETHDDLQEYQRLVRLGPDKREPEDNKELTRLAKKLRAQPLPQKLDESVLRALEEVKKELGL